LRIERHVFGSFSGYGTLARSPGLSPDDCRFLEGSAYAFGQTDDRRYLKSLRASPAFFTRSMRGGRRALTRVIEGAPDDGGRPTLSMVTAVLSQRDWDGELCGDVGALLRQAPLWAWRPGDELPAIDLPAPALSTSIGRRSAAKVAQLVSQIENSLASGAGSPVIVACDEFSAEEVAVVEMLVPPAARSRFTSAWRSLSAQFPATLNCLAPEAPAQTITYRLDASAPLTTYVQFLADQGLSRGQLPVAEVLTYQRFARSSRQHAPAPVPATVAPPPPPPVRRWPLKWVTGSAAMAASTFALGFYLGTRTTSPPQALVTVAPTTAPSTVAERGSPKPMSSKGGAGESGPPSANDPAAVVPSEKMPPESPPGPATPKTQTAEATPMTPAGEPQGGGSDPSDDTTEASTSSEPATASSPVPSTQSQGPASATKPVVPSVDVNRTKRLGLFDTAKSNFSGFADSMRRNGTIDTKSEPGRSTKEYLLLVEGMVEEPTDEEKEWRNENGAIVNPLARLFGSCRRAEDGVKNFDPKLSGERRRQAIEPLSQLRDEVKAAMSELRKSINDDDLKYNEAIEICDQIDRMTRQHAKQ